MNLPALQFRSAVPWWLVISLRHRFHLDAFVETGTAYGDTAVMASELGIFKRIVTIEVSPDLYAKAHPELQASKIERHLGPSEKRLAEVVATLTTPALFFLDAHWPGGGQKMGPECPLLAELAVLRPRQKAGVVDVIIIDDAGMFVHPPKPPHDPSEWPSYPQIKEAISTLENCMFVVANIIIISPEPIWFEF